MLEVYCYSRQCREKSSHLRLQSVYLNSAKFTQFIQKGFCRKLRCHFSVFSVLHVQSSSTLPDPRAWPVITQAEHVQISVRAKQSSNAAGKPIRLSGVSRAILVSVLLENENFIQMLDNSPDLVTSGTRLKFGLSGSIIMDMGTQPVGGK